MIPPPDVAVWAIIAAAVPSGVVGLVSWFAKRELSAIEASIGKVAIQVESLHSSFVSQDKSMALLEMRLTTLENEQREMRRREP